ncbi:ankyrin repeat-containing domain protein [Xylaria arbuscula]|nr:ankyrin repeat-containing domain protein [Xylaria arbuscula]
MSDSTNTLPLRPNVDTIPSEVLLEISGYLTSKEDATSLMKTCRHTYGIGKEKFHQLVIEYDNDGSAFRAAIAHGITVVFERMLHINRHPVDMVFDCPADRPYQSEHIQTPTPLITAIEYNRPSFVDKLLQAGANVNFALQCSESMHDCCYVGLQYDWMMRRHFPPIYWALGMVDGKPSLDIVKSLLSHNVDVNYRPPCERKRDLCYISPLSLAVSQSSASEKILREVLKVYRLKFDPHDFQHQCLDAMHAFFSQAGGEFCKYREITDFPYFGEEDLAKLQFMLANAFEGTIQAMGRVFRAMTSDCRRTENITECMRIYLQVMSQKGLLSDAFDTITEDGSSASPDGPTKGVDSAKHPLLGTSPLTAICITFGKYSKLGPRFVKFFLSRGANLDHHDQHDLTPLHWAARYRYEDAGALLLNEARLQSKNIVNTRGKGWTPLMIACQYSNSVYRTTGLEDWIRFIKLLLDNGADVHATDDNNQNALHHICVTSNRTTDSWEHNRDTGNYLLPIIRCLMDAGVDASHRDGRGRTPMEYLHDSTKARIKA